jgi:glycosyltransferase involved in cell wall biosynthesis
VADDESALARAVKDGGFGRNLTPGKPEELADTFRELAQDRQLLRDWGQTGREYVKRFEHQRVLGDFFGQLEMLV